MSNAKNEILSYVRPSCNLACVITFVYGAVVLCCPDASLWLIGLCSWAIFGLPLWTVFAIRYLNTRKVCIHALEQMGETALAEDFTNALTKDSWSIRIGKQYCYFKRHGMVPRSGLLCLYHSPGNVESIDCLYAYVFINGRKKKLLIGHQSQSVAAEIAALLHCGLL